MKKNKDKALVWELKGDNLLKAKKDEKAFDAYQKALDLDPERVPLYTKIIELHEKYIDNWDDQDFAYNLSLSMKRQEIENPYFKRVHARLEEDYQKILPLIKKMFEAKTIKSETKYVEEIHAKGPVAIYPLIDYLMSFKEIGKKKLEKKAKQNAQNKSK